MPHPVFRFVFACLFAGMAWFVPAAARAQAGPPMIANDPGTPGPGHWEINLAAIGERARGETALDAPYVDVNYGVGERIQLSLESPWAHRRSTAWASGSGDVEYGMRWRFLDQKDDDAPLSMAVQGVWTDAYSRRSRERGLAAPQAEFALPLQLAHEGEAISIGAEVVRHFVARDADFWQAGVYAKRDCARGWECIAEINDSWDGGAQPVLNVGARHPFNPHWILLASCGKQVAAPAGEARPWLFYLGVQFLSEAE